MSDDKSNDQKSGGLQTESESTVEITPPDEQDDSQDSLTSNTQNDG